jgi:hypothetical protein
LKYIGINKTKNFLIKFFIWFIMVWKYEYYFTMLKKVYVLNYNNNREEMKIEDKYVWYSINKLKLVNYCRLKKKLFIDLLLRIIKNKIFLIKL